MGLLEKATPVLASNTADVTVLVAIEWGGILPPSNFRVTRITDTQVLLEWTPAVGANTSIRMKVDSLPEDFNDGYLVYTGNASSFYDEWLNLDTMWSKVYYIAYSENATGGRSESYIWDYTENPYVAEVAENLSWLSNLSTAGMGLLYLLPLLIISVLAFWKESFTLFMIAFGLAMVSGLNAPDIINGKGETTSMGLAIGILLMVYAIFCAAMSFRLMYFYGSED
jgi:hypothetical protein